MATPLDANDPAFVPVKSNATRIKEDLEMAEQGTAVINRAENQGLTAFERFSNRFRGTAIVGNLLRFNKGAWYSGREEQEIPAGTLMMAQMKTLSWGFQKWVAQKPVEARFARMCHDEMPPKREELGDLDQSQWEINERGERRDPWQETVMLLMMDKEGQVYTLTGSSRGMLQAVATLAGIYDRTRRMKPHAMPIVALKTDKYKHRVYSWIPYPVFDVKGWVHEDQFADISADMVSNGQEPEEDEADLDDRDDLFGNGFGPKAVEDEAEVIPPPKPAAKAKAAPGRAARARGDL